MMVSGCTQSGPSAATPVVSPASTTQKTGAQDPIIGTWIQQGVSWDFRFQFNPDGTYTRNENFGNNANPLIVFGTWSNQGSNTYLLTQKGYNNQPSNIEPAPSTYIYSPSQNTLTAKGDTNVVYVRQNVVVLTETPTTKK
jgi:hypothetical protein